MRREARWNAESVMRKASGFAYDGFPHPGRSAVAPLDVIATDELTASVGGEESVA